jgi:ribosomal protein S18 acetylase RimI-like enzyme
MDAPDESLAEGAALRIRRAGIPDARAIAEIVVAGWQSAYRGLMPDGFLDSLSVAGRETAWREMLARDSEGGLPAWLAQRDGRVVGFVSSGPPRDEDVPLSTAEVYAIYVLPEAWRRGVGQTLLETATGHWRARGIATLVLWVLEGNDRARRFYEAMGWQPDGGRQVLEIAGAKLYEIRYRLGPIHPEG